MKVLIVSSGNNGEVTSFVKEQADSLAALSVEIMHFLIIGKKLGYLKNYLRLRKTIKTGRYDLVHAHYGFSGLLCVLQRLVPVVITFHGCDVNRVKYRIFSKVAMFLSAHVIFVNDSMPQFMKAKKDSSVIPCGIDDSLFKPYDKEKARKNLNLYLNKKYILFSSSYERPEKNYSLAKQAAELIGDVTMLEFKGYSREQTMLLYNAVDVLLLTSVREGSPQVIKEAIACNCPVVSTNVGDVRSLIHDLEGCYICSFEAENVAEKIKMALSAQKPEYTGRIKELGLDAAFVAGRLLGIYERVLKERG